MSTRNYVFGGRVRAAFSGIEYAILRDNRVRYKVVLSMLFLTTTLLFDDWFHFLLLLGVTGLMIVAEIFDSTIAALCDYVQPGHDTLVTAVRDMSIAASWIAVLIWMINVIVVLYELVVLIRSR